MIDLDLLRSVKTVVTHEGCADGVASALILKDALPDARVLFVQYNTQRWRELTTELRGLDAPVLFCDMTPRPEDADLFDAARSVVLDHHRGARELVAKFSDRGVFADEEAEPGVSGALLAFREVWCRLRESSPMYSPVNQVRDFAALAGIRDTWQRSSPRWREACAQAAALRFWPWEDLEGLSLTGDAFASRLDIGPVLLRREAEKVERTIGEAHYFTAAGRQGVVSVAAFEGLHTSDVADQLAAADVELVLGWHYACERDSQKMVVSVRSRGEFSALRLAKRHGGGGHDRAAGFTLDLWRQPALSPYDLLEWVVGEAVSA